MPRRQNPIDLSVSASTDGFTIGGGATERNLTIRSGDITIEGGTGNVFDLPPSSDTLVGEDSTQTLTNKIITGSFTGSGRIESASYAVTASYATNAGVSEGIFSSSAQVDHGGVQGLGDDDHTQYLRTDGTRALTGPWNANNEITASKIIAQINSSSIAGPLTISIPNWITANTFDNLSFNSTLMPHYGIRWAADPSGINSALWQSGYGGIRFFTAGQSRWLISSSGHFVPGVHNTYDIGSADSWLGTLRSTNIYGTTGVINTITNTTLNNVTLYSTQSYVEKLFQRVTNNVHSSLSSQVVPLWALDKSPVTNQYWFQPPMAVEFYSASEWHPDPASGSAAYYNLTLGRNAGTAMSLPISSSGWEKWRITMLAPSYRFLDYLYLYTSTNGHGLQLAVERSVSTSSVEWVPEFTTSIWTAWPGHQFIPHDSILIHPNGNSGQAKYVRMIFEPSYSGAQPTNDIDIFHFNWYGTYPGNQQNQLWSWNVNKGVSFTSITASAGISGLINSASFAQNALTANSATTATSASTSIKSNTSSVLVIPDYRNDGFAPDHYGYEAQFEFKTKTAATASFASGTYGGLMTVAPWTDDSGGPHSQLFFASESLYYRRGAPNSTVWEPWKRILTTDNNLRTDLTGSFYADKTLYHLSSSVYFLNTLSSPDIRAFHYPKKAHYTNDTSGFSGSIQIALPKFNTVTNGMIDMAIDVYQYRDDASFTVLVSGYVYSSGHSWRETTVRLLQSSTRPGEPGPPTDHIVLATVDSGTVDARPVILIGDEQTTWYYPKVAVSRAMVGYSTSDNYPYENGWSGSLVQDTSSYTDRLDFRGAGLLSTSASYALTASYAVKALSSSYADTAGATGGSVGGSGTPNYIPKWGGATTLTNSIISEIGGAIYVPGRISSSFAEVRDFDGNSYIDIRSYTESAIVRMFASSSRFAGQYLYDESSVSTRWLLVKDDTHESGANSGSNYSIYRYADNGSYLGRPVRIHRVSGDIDLESKLRWGGGPYIASSADVGAASDVAARLHVSGTTVGSYFVGPKFAGFASSSVGNGVQSFPQIGGFLALPYGNTAATSPFFYAWEGNQLQMAHRQPGVQIAYVSGSGSGNFSNVFDTLGDNWVDLYGLNSGGDVIVEISGLNLILGSANTQGFAFIEMHGGQTDFKMEVGIDTNAYEEVLNAAVLVSSNPAVKQFTTANGGAITKVRLTFTNIQNPAYVRRLGIIPKNRQDIHNWLNTAGGSMFGDVNFYTGSLILNFDSISGKGDLRLLDSVGFQYSIITSGPILYFKRTDSSPASFYWRSLNNFDQMVLDTNGLSWGDDSNYIPSSSLVARLDQDNNFGANDITASAFKGDGSQLTGISAGGISWSTITGGATASVNTGYFTNSASQLSVYLPTTAVAGDLVRIAGVNTGGWRLRCNSSQQIHFGNDSSSLGPSGYLQSTHYRDSVEVVCIAANNTWQVISSIGAIDIV